MADQDNIPDWVKDLLTEEESFWKLKYPSYSFSEKVKHWSGILHRQMRWQNESGLDPYAIFNQRWYENVKKVEPDFDKIMDEVFATYWSSTGGEWSKEEYLKRIRE